MNKNLIEELNKQSKQDIEELIPLILHYCDEANYLESAYANSAIGLITVRRKKNLFYSKSYTFYKPISKLY